MTKLENEAIAPDFSGAVSALESSVDELKARKNDPLEDVKFYPGDVAMCTRGEFCFEAQAMDIAIAKGRAEELIFNDSTVAES